MYTVLLVDDEENTIKILKNLLQWQNLGVSEIFTASDGQQALEIFKQHRINLLITDIKMPHLDGISLIEMVKSLYPEVKCILLTAYSEFEYARRAIMLGVENYLLKPVVKGELEHTVENALDNLYRKRFGDKEQLRENILRRWVSGNISSEELGDRAEFLQLNLFLPQYCAICIMKKTLYDIRKLLADCEHLLAEKMEVYSFWDENGRYVLIIGGKEINLAKMSQELQKLIVGNMAEDRVRISLGEVVYDVAFLHLSYQKACDGMKVFQTGQSCVIVPDDDFGIKLNTEYMIEEIRFLLFCNDEKIRSNGYKRLGEKLYRERRKKDTCDLLVIFGGMCMRILTTEFPLCTDLEEDGFYLQKLAGKEFSKTEFIKIVEKILFHTQQVFDQSFSYFSPIVQKACRYIRDSVLNGDSCSINEFCIENNMNAAYLGHIYKKETGRFFNAYLLDCRINRSVILLHNPTNQIKEIAEKVGFSSVSYFVQKFRECKGMSPKKYQNMMDRQL